MDSHVMIFIKQPISGQGVRHGTAVRRMAVLVAHQSTGAARVENATSASACDNPATTTAFQYRPQSVPVYRSE